MKTLPILMLLASGGAALAQAQPAAAPVSGRAEAPRQATPSQATPARATPAQAAMPLAPGTQVMTLEQAERLLVDRNLAVIAARRGVDSARAQRLVASSLPPAVVSAGNTFGQFNEGGRPAAGAPNTANITGARFLGLQNNVTVGLQVLVELGGKRTLRTRLAEENIGAAEAQVLDALRSQLYVLRLNFFTALGARANLEVALGNRAGLDRTEALLRRQLRDGAIPEGDLLRFQASRVVFENDVVTNAQAYAAAVAQIAVTLAADAADFRPGEPPAVPARRGATSGDPVRATLSALAFDVRGRFNTIPDLGIGREELGTAVQDRPDVVAALRQASAAGANLALTEAARWRDVTVNAGFARTRLNQNVPSGTIPLLANDQFSVQLSVPIFTRRIVEGNVGVAAGQAGQADALARGALLQARADFAIAWSAVEQSRNLLRVYTGGALGRAEAAYRSAEQAYTAGGSSLLEVLDALRTLNATRLAANVARTNYLVALAQLEQATGVSGVSPRL